MARKYLDTTGLTALWAKIKGLFVKRSGDIMTGALVAPSFTASANGSPTINSQSTDVDASKANNDISSDHYPGWMVSDKYGRILTRMECVASSNGNIAAYWYVRNYNTSGSQVGQKGIKITMAKDGSIAYTIDDNSKFRTALGLATVASSGSYNDLSNKPTIPDISGKVNKSGDTMTGALTMNNANANVKDTDVKVGTAPSSTIYGNGYYCQSNNGGDLFYVRATQDTSDNVGMQIEVRRAIGSTTYYNMIRLGISNNGTKTVGISDGAAWRSAIGCGGIATYGGLSAPSFSKVHSNVYEWSYNCHRFGNVVVLTGYFRCNTQISSNQVLFNNLPKPYNSTTIYFIMEREGSEDVRAFRITSSGELRTNQTTPAQTYVGTITYICA